MAVAATTAAVAAAAPAPAMAMEAQATPAELSDFEKKGEKIWAELVNDTNVRVEDIVKKAEDSVSGGSGGGRWGRWGGGWGGIKGW